MARVAMKGKRPHKLFFLGIFVRFKLSGQLAKIDVYCSHSHIDYRRMAGDELQVQAESFSENSIEKIHSKRNPMAPKFNAVVLGLARIGLVPIALGTSHVAFAQQDAQKVEKVLVTGSNIKRIDAEGPLPVLVITREEIERSAAPSVGEYLRTLTVNSGGSTSESAINNQSGASGVSLRGLGQKSTLVLINGRRMANHAFAKGTQDTFVDINSIPKGAIERIEILKDGASAIYGSDAIAGVVNFILRKDYQGATASASGGRSTEGGLGERSVSLSAGFGSMAKDKYNVLAIVDYFHRDRLLLSERKWLGDGDLSRFPGGGNAFLSSSAGTYVFVPSLNGVARGAFATCLGNGFRFTVTPFAAPFFTTGTLCAHTTTPFITAYPEANNIGLTTRGTVEINEHTNAFGEVSIANNQSKWINQPQTMTQLTQVYNPATLGGRLFSVVLPVGNASNPFNRTVQLRYTFFDVGARTIKLDTNVYRVLAGVSGTAGSWDWEAAVSASQSKIKEQTGNQVDADVLSAAITNNTYNFLAPTQAQTDAIRIGTERNSTSDLTNADVKATRTLTTLAGGPLGLALGLDVRKEKITDTPDPKIVAGKLLGTAASATTGSRNVAAAYAELSVPVAKTLEFQLAARGDHYSDFGSAVSPKIGAKYTPVKELLIRGSLSKGFRAPTLAENSQATSITFIQIAGAAQNVIVSQVFTGNPNLKAEKSDSASIGFVFEPNANFSFGVDYYKIVQKDLVSPNGAQFIVNNPTLFPGDIIRDASGGIVSIRDRYNNVAKVEASGFDTETRFTLPKDMTIGKITLRAATSYLSSFKQPPAIGAELVQYAGTNGGPRGALPRARSKMGIDWDYKGWAVSLNSNFVGHYDQKNPNVTAPGTKTIDSQITQDVYVSFSPLSALKLVASVQNISDRQPSFDAAQGFFDTSQYDLRGRYVRAGLEYKFK